MRKILLMLLILTLIFTGCTAARDSQNNEESNAVNPVDNENSENPGSTVEDKDIYFNANLTELKPQEKEIYENFKKKYDNEVLRDLDPVVVAKFYLYATKTEDRETQYELYIDDENHVQWSKEEHLSFPKDDQGVMDNYLQQFKNVDIYFEKDVNNEKYGSVRIVNKEFPYIMMTKNSAGIWKINFLPGQ
jgi:hypothetical protein